MYLCICGISRRSKYIYTQRDLAVVKTEQCTMPKVFCWICSKSGCKHLKSISFIPLEYSFGKLPGEIFDWTFHNFATHATNQYTSWITCHSQGLLVRFVKKKPLFLWLSFTFYFSFCLISNKNLIIAVSISVPIQSCFSSS